MIGSRFMRILTGIVTFNPEIDRLKENLNSIVPQDTDILIFDNGSKNIAEVSELAQKKNCKIISVLQNQGIAFGLKQIMDYAIKNGYEWVLTLDQDSITTTKLIDEYKKYCGDSKVGALTCNIKDRNFFEVFEKKENTVQNVRTCITSGCFMRVAAYKSTSGYDVSMFIDFVDFDICYALIKAGYSIIKIPFEGLLHEDGHGVNVSFFGKKYIMYHKSAWRRFYMMRNEIYLARKFPEIQSPFITTLRCFWQICLVFIYEEDKFSKLKNGLRGVLKGVTMKIPSMINKG